MQTLEIRDQRRETRADRQEAVGKKSVRRPLGSWLLLIAFAGLLTAASSQSSLALQKGPATVNAPAAEPSEEQLDQARGALDRFLDSHPEIQGEVIGEPGRLADPNYIHDKPELQAFFDSHPLVKADPRAFISPAVWRFQNRRSDTDELLSWFIPFLVFICCLLAVLWVLRVVLENRRWNKSFRIHEEVHTKLIEKFASGQDLTAYMGSDAGRRLLEWTPPPIDTGSRGVQAAAGRILRSVLAGLILCPAGIGLLWIRGWMPDAVEPLLVFGTLGLTIGAGFIISSFVSYALSKHLGLMGTDIQSEPRLRIDSSAH
jgi:hypothetical protein